MSISQQISIQHMLLERRSNLQKNKNQPSATLLFDLISIPQQHLINTHILEPKHMQNSALIHTSKVQMKQETWRVWKHDRPKTKKRWTWVVHGVPCGHRLRLLDVDHHYVRSEECFCDRCSMLQAAPHNLCPTKTLFSKTSSVVLKNYTNPRNAYPKGK